MEGLVVMAMLVVAGLLAFALARGVLQLKDALRELRDWNSEDWTK